MSPARRSRVLATPRLWLEAINRRHTDGLWRAVQMSLAELQPWMPWAVDAQREEEAVFVAEAARRFSRDQGWVFAILFEDQPIGTIGLDSYQPLVRSAEVGYWLRSDLAGQGLMTEAASVVVEFAFGEIGLHRLHLQAAPDNHASIRVAKKLGFKREGLLRDASRGAGGFHDVYVFGLLETDTRRRFH